MENKQLTETLECLTVLSKLQQNKKLKTRSGKIEIDNRRELLQWLVRKDKREKCHEFVSKTFDNSITQAKMFLKQYMDDKNDDSLEKDRFSRLLGSLLLNIKSAVTGYETQLATYKDDDGHTAKISVLLEQVREEVLNIELKLNNYNKSNNNDNNVRYFVTYKLNALQRAESIFRYILTTNKFFCK